MKSEPKTKISDDGEEVVMSTKDFEDLVGYVRRLEHVVEVLNAQIEEYNEKFADAEKDRT